MGWPMDLENIPTLEEANRPALEAEEHWRSARIEQALEAFAQAAEYQMRIADQYSSERSASKCLMATSACSLFYKARKYNKALENAARFDREIGSQCKGLADVIREAAIGKDLVAFHEERVRSAVTDYEMELKQKVSSLLEYFGGTSAYLFILHGDTLSAEVVQNGGDERIELRLDSEPSITAHVARKKRGYVAPDTDHDSLYLKIKTTTRSEMAVPVLDAKGELVGVLNLEANVPGVFTAAQVHELQAKSVSLSVEIALLRSWVTYEKFCGWSPSRHGWGIDRLLRDFCFKILDRVGGPTTQLTCSIWERDRDKDQMYVCATAGYDTEYIAHKTLPVASFTGSISNLPRGSVQQGDWRDFDNFVRGDKAKRMGIQQIISTPIYFPETSQAWGVLHVYLFNETVAVTETLVAHLADIVGAIVASYQSLIPAIAAECCRARLTQQASKLPHMFESVRSVLSECLSADGCSLFGYEGDSNRLVCVASTGLESDGSIVNWPEAAYDLEVDRNSITASLFREPNRVFRKNDVPDPDEKVDGTKITPLNKFRECFSLSATDHRRFLGCGVFDPEGSLGVIRLNRRAESAPFVKSDEAVCRAVVDVAAPVFRQWSRQRIEDRTFRRSVRISTERKDLLQAAANLLRPIEDERRHDVRISQEILQDLLVAFSEQKALMASLREVTTSLDSHERLEIRAFHSTRSRRAFDDDRYGIEKRPVGTIGGSNAWLSVDSQRIVTFDRNQCGELFRGIHHDSSRVRSGVCVPLTTFAFGGVVRWVFCVDFESLFEWTKEHFFWLFYAAHKLTTIAEESTWKGPTRPRDYFDAFLKSSQKITAAKAILLELPTVNGKLRRICERGRLPRAESGWKNGLGLDGLLGLQYNERQQLLRLYLRSGPAVSGRLSWKSAKGLSRLTGARISLNWGRLFSDWSYFPYLTKRDSYIVSPRLSRATNIQAPTGIQVWDGLLPVTKDLFSRAGDD
jgi:hypothetical protein